MCCIQSSGDHGSAHMGGRKKLRIPVASPALPPESETCVPPTPGRVPLPSAAATRLARQAMGSAGKRAGLAAHPPSHPNRTAGWHPPSVYDSRQGPASAAVTAVATRPGGDTTLYSTPSSQPRSVVGACIGQSFDAQLLPSRETHDASSESNMAADFLAFNVIVSPAVAESSSKYGMVEGTHTIASDSSGVIASPAESRLYDSASFTTDVKVAGVAKTRRGGRRGRRPRPQSAPAVPSSKGAPTVGAWDDVENRPSFEVTGLRAGVR